MKGVYNKEALNRIAAQDRLDKMIVLVSPAVWISIVGAFLIITGLILWGFFGNLPTTIETTGIYMNSDGVSYIYSKTEGFVVSINVNDGDTVKEGDVIATLGGEDDIYKIKQLDTRIQYVESTTFDSEMDIVTNDTQPLQEIKLAAKNNDNEKENTKASLNLKKEKLSEAQALVDQKEQLMLKYKQDFYATLNVTDNESQLTYNEADTDYNQLYSLYETYKQNYISLQETYYQKKDEFDSRYYDYDEWEKTEAEIEAHDAALAGVNDAEAAAADAKYLLDEQENKLREANEKLEGARKTYLEYVNSLSETTALNTIASTEYAEVLQDYYTAKASYKTLKDEIDELELQSVVAEGNAKQNIENYEQKFDNQKSAVLIDLKSQRDMLFNNANKSSIKASKEGIIYDVLVSEGQGIAIGTNIATIVDNNENDDTAIFYVKLTDAKKLKVGMDVYVYPSTVNKQEYGHIIGKISSIEGHVASNEDMKFQLGSDSLVNDFKANGSVVEVRCSLNRDASTSSGYEWSSKKGNKIDLVSGTVIGATIVTEEKRPIDLLIPYLKDKLDFEVEADDEEKNKS